MEAPCHTSTGKSLTKTSLADDTFQLRTADHFAGFLKSRNFDANPDASSSNRRMSSTHSSSGGPSSCFWGLPWSTAEIVSETQSRLQLSLAMNLLQLRGTWRAQIPWSANSKVYHGMHGAISKTANVKSQGLGSMVKWQFQLDCNYGDNISGVRSMWPPKMF